MTDRITRRDFVCRGAFFAAALSASRTASRLARRTERTLRIGVVAPSSPAAAERQQLGIELGLDEARHAAQLFGGAVESTALSAPAPRDRQLSAVIGGGDVTSSASWIEHASAMGIIYMNVGCTSDELRGARCSRAAFHVIPSDAMYHDAISRDATTATAGGAAASVAAWDSSLSRFGADTLNERFHARFGQPMTTEAWTAWLAVKILWESALRQKSVAAASLASYLDQETTQLDGHKGQPLSFRSWDHQLRQPVYVITASGPGAPRTVREAPVVSADESPRAALDRLGTGPSASACKLQR
jgi:hypothetical protein